MLWFWKQSYIRPPLLGCPYPFMSHDAQTVSSRPMQETVTHAYLSIQPVMGMCVCDLEQCCCTRLCSSELCDFSGIWNLVLWVWAEFSRHQCSCWKLHFTYTVYFLFRVCLGGRMHEVLQHMYGSGGWTKVARLGGRHLYWLSHFFLALHLFLIGLFDLFKRDLIKATSRMPAWI